MYYCNELISLSVLSLYEGELLGVVNKLYFDKKIKKLMEIEIIGENDVRLILPTKNIYHIGKNAITIKNNQSLQIKTNASELCACPINSKAYNINGEYLGTIKEIGINDKYLTTKFCLDNDKTLEVKDIASCGKNTVIFFENGNKIDLKKFTPQSPKDFKQEIQNKVEILPDNSKEKTNAELVENAKTQLSTPEFLIGRVCTKDIFNFNNELLIKAHSIVTKKNLQEVNKFGKLRELMLYLK